MQTIKEKVLYCLSKYPDTRNSDTKLTNAVWYEFYRDYLETINKQTYIKILDLYKIPTQDDIKRWRAKIQNPNLKKGYKGKYPPTSLEVAKKRKWLEEDWRRALGYSPELRTI